MHEKEDDLAEVTEMVWNASLGMEAQRAGSAALDGHELLVGRVDLNGAYNGAILIECPQGLVRLAAGVLFFMEPDDASDDDMRDAIGEIANVIAGNARGLFEHGTTIGLPVVDSNLDNALHGDDTTDDVGFTSNGFPFRVVVVGSKQAA